MAIRKVSIFILVIAFHLVVLGVVYVSTREPGDSETEELSDKVEDSTSTTDSSAAAPVNPRPAPVTQTVTTSRSSSTSGKTFIHVVEKGDFLGKIAAKYKVSSEVIMDLNNIDNPNKLYLGQKIKIPVK